MLSELFLKNPRLEIIKNYMLGENIEKKNTVSCLKIFLKIKILAKVFLKIVKKNCSKKFLIMCMCVFFIYEFCVYTLFPFVVS